MLMGERTKVRWSMEELLWEEESVLVDGLKISVAGCE
jgi:hypothetical protein